MEGQFGLFAAAFGLGLLHGVLPDHGWPIAAAYAIDRTNRWASGIAAGLIIGIGHLASSIALVLIFFWASGHYDLVGSPLLGYVSGTLLVLLGVREYFYGGHHHDHSHGEEVHFGHDNCARDGHEERDGHDEHNERERSDDHANPADRRGVIPRLRTAIPTFGYGDHHDHGDHERGGHDHGDHDHNGHDHGADVEERSLRSLAVVAIALGIAHEEPIQIIAICAGTVFCLEAMIVYSLAVIVAILVPTLLLIAGYERHRETVERYTPHLSTLTAGVLILMGLAFIVGVF